jgi:hypothetical protein
MYEVFSEGAKPYVGWSNKKVVDEVKTGYRLPQPDGCPDEVYGLMLQCWYAGPDLRPDFEKLEGSLQDAVSAAEVEKGAAPAVEQPRSNVLDRLNTAKKDAMLAESLQADSKSGHTSVVTRSKRQSFNSKLSPSKLAPLAPRSGLSISRQAKIMSPKPGTNSQEPKDTPRHNVSYVALLGQDDKPIQASQVINVVPPVHHETVSTGVKLLPSRKFSGHLFAHGVDAVLSLEPGMFFILRIC